MAEPQIGAVVIGRNEGERLRRCLASMAGKVARVVYVDSGSTDGSLEMARDQGATIVELDLSKPFTAARARNAGIAALNDPPGPAPDYIQFVDGDCELREGWLETALAFLERHRDVAVACGRRRERFPEASVYNRLTDLEWDTPVGEARACGGDALMRGDALTQVGGYDPSLIAGEEPELCVRLRAAGWKIWRLDAEMTWHDAAITALSQWWKRARRAGHAYAEGAAMHGRPPERHKVTETRRALLWGAALPLGVGVLALVISPWALGLLLVYPAQIARIAAKTGDPVQAGFLMLGKFPEALGALDYWQRRLRGQRSRLIEYKGA